MEGRTPAITSLSKEQNEEETHVNKVTIYNLRSSVKNPPFYLSFKNYDKKCSLLFG